MEALSHLLGRSCPNGSARPSTTSSTGPDDLAAYTARRAQWANAVPGRLEGVACEACLGRGYSMIPQPDGTLLARRCRCMGLRAARAAMRRSGLDPAALDEAVWDRWETPERWQLRARELGQEYVRRVLREPGFDGWFAVAGRPGSGKTRLCATVLRAILAGGRSGRYVSWRSLARQAKGSANDAVRFSALVDPLRRTPVLYVDDFWKGGATQADLGLAFELLSERYAAHLPTIVSTELTLDALLRLDEAVGSRIAERSQGFYLDVSRARDRRLPQEGV